MSFLQGLYWLEKLWRVREPEMLPSLSAQSRGDSSAGSEGARGDSEVTDELLHICGTAHPGFSAGHCLLSHRSTGMSFPHPRSPGCLLCPSRVPNYTASDHHELTKKSWDQIH